jgi:hypothetical protein
MVQLKQGIALFSTRVRDPGPQKFGSESVINGTTTDPDPSFNKETNYEKPLFLHFCDFLKGQCHEIFCIWFFHESVSPKPLSIPLGPFRIFSKIRGDIRSSRLTTAINDTGGKISTGINDTGDKFCHQFP